MQAESKGNNIHLVQFGLDAAARKSVRDFELNRIKERDEAFIREQREHVMTSISPGAAASITEYVTNKLLPDAEFLTDGLDESTDEVRVEGEGISLELVPYDNDEEMTEWHSDNEADELQVVVRIQTSRVMAAPELMMIQRRYRDIRLASEGRGIVLVDTNVSFVGGTSLWQLEMALQRTIACAQSLLT